MGVIIGGDFLKDKMISGESGGVGSLGFREPCDRLRDLGDTRSSVGAIV